MKHRKQKSAFRSLQKQAQRRGDGSPDAVNTREEKPLDEKAILNSQYFARFVDYWDVPSADGVNPYIP